MKVNALSIHKLPNHEEKLVWSLYDDLLKINKIIEDNIDINKSIYLHWQDWHNEYSAERTDPCPDYYGTYKLINSLGETIGEYMDIDELDKILFTIEELLNHLYDKKEA